MDITFSKAVLFAVILNPDSIVVRSIQRSMFEFNSSATSRSVLSPMARSFVMWMPPMGKTATCWISPSSTTTKLVVPAPISSKTVPDSFCCRLRTASAAAKLETVMWLRPHVLVLKQWSDFLASAKPPLQYAYQLLAAHHASQLDL